MYALIASIVLLSVGGPTISDEWKEQFNDPTLSDRDIALILTLVAIKVPGDILSIEVVKRTNFLKDQHPNSRETPSVVDVHVSSNGGMNIEVVRVYRWEFGWTLDGPGGDDDVAQQLRQAAEAETDPTRASELYNEYMRYKESLTVRYSE